MGVPSILNETNELAQLTIPLIPPPPYDPTYEIGIRSIESEQKSRAEVHPPLTTYRIEQIEAGISKFKTKQMTKEEKKIFKEIKAVLSSNDLFHISYCKFFNSLKAEYTQDARDPRDFDCCSCIPCLATPAPNYKDITHCEYDPRIYELWQHWLRLRKFETDKGFNDGLEAAARKIEQANIVSGNLPMYVRLKNRTDFDNELRAEINNYGKLRSNEAGDRQSMESNLIYKKSEYRDWVAQSVKTELGDCKESNLSNLSNLTLFAYSVPLFLRWLEEQQSGQIPMSKKENVWWYFDSSYNKHCRYKPGRPCPYPQQKNLIFKERYRQFQQPDLEEGSGLLTSRERFGNLLEVVYIEEGGLWG